MTDEQIRKIYNKFPPEGRDMPFGEFVKQVKSLTDPNKIRQDLMGIQMQKAVYDTNKIRIDRALKHDLN